MKEDLILSSTPLANYTFEEETNIIHVEMKMNRYTDLEIINDFFEDIEKVPCKDCGYFLLVNCLEIGQTNASVRQYIHEKINSKMNSIAVITSPLMVGPMSLFVNLFRPKHAQVKMFSKMEEASNWLSNQMKMNQKIAS